MTLFYIRFIWPMNDRPEITCKSSQRAWDISTSYCHMCHLKQIQIPWITLWLPVKPALTNACGLMYFLYLLFFLMTGSKMVTGVVGFVIPLQEEIWMHLNFRNSCMPSYPASLPSLFCLIYITIGLINTKHTQYVVTYSPPCIRHVIHSEKQETPLGTWSLYVSTWLRLTVMVHNYWQAI